MTPQYLHGISGLIQDDIIKINTNVNVLNAWETKVYNLKPDLRKLM